jgi:hypothetical protein
MEDSMSISSPTTQQTMIGDFKTTEAAVLAARLAGPLGGDQTAEIMYDLGAFSIRVHVVSGPPADPRPLTVDELPVLLATLRSQLKDHPPGIDMNALRAFIELLDAAVQAQPSERFAGVRFGEIVKDTAGAVIWYVSLGVDLAGSIHDHKGKITFEQHVVPMPPAQSRPLHRRDRLSMAAAVAKFVEEANTQLRPINPLWLQVLEDLKR